MWPTLWRERHATVRAVQIDEGPNESAPMPCSAARAQLMCAENCNPIHGSVPGGSQRTRLHRWLAAAPSDSRLSEPHPQRAEVDDRRPVRALSTPCHLPILRRSVPRRSPAASIPSPRRPRCGLALAAEPGKYRARSVAATTSTAMNGERSVQSHRPARCARRRPSSRGGRTAPRPFCAGRAVCVEAAVACDQSGR